MLQALFDGQCATLLLRSLDCMSLPSASGDTFVRTIKIRVHAEMIIQTRTGLERDEVECNDRKLSL